MTENYYIYFQFLEKYKQITARIICQKPPAWYVLF